MSKLDEALDAYGRQRTRVLELKGAALPDLRTRLKSAREHVSSLEAQLAELEGVERRERRRLAELGAAIGPLVHADVSGCCGKVDPEPGDTSSEAEATA